MPSSRRYGNLRRAEEIHFCVAAAERHDCVCVAISSFSSWTTLQLVKCSGRLCEIAYSVQIREDKLSKRGQPFWLRVCPHA